MRFSTSVILPTCDPLQLVKRDKSFYGARGQDYEGLGNQGRYENHIFNLAGQSKLKIYSRYIYI
jgi:hypothetical protein